MPFKIDGTFDFEAHAWDQFALGAIYGGNPAVRDITDTDKMETHVFYNIDNLIDDLRKRGGTWWSHAGGVFDLLAILERARVRGIPCQVDRSQHRVSRIVMGSLTLRDSYGLWPVPLDDLCGAIGESVPELPWKCICEQRTKWNGHKKRRGCGGYCQIGARANAGDPDLEDYCIADCRRLYHALVWLSENTHRHGIELEGTLGQTAWKSAQRELGVPDSEIPWHLWRHARRADKGGRVAIIRPLAPGPGAHHDICNAYPAQLARAELPVGDARELGAKHARNALESACPGVYQCTVYVPDSLFLPPLPWSSGGQIWYPTGEFHGVWTLPELCAAFERGVALVEVHTALIWDATAPVFAALVERWYEIRRNVGRKTPMGQWIGRLAKALTGKFAERPERERVSMHPDEIKICEREGKCKDGCTGSCGAYVQLDLLGYIWGVPYAKMAPSAYPQWSSYLRAMTRIQWLEQAERYGEDLCFGNTDSLWVQSRGLPVPSGNGLGQWEYQHAWTDLDVRSANTYAFRQWSAFPSEDEYKKLWNKKRARKEDPDREGRLVLRGVPGMTEDDWKAGRGVLDRGVVTFGQAVGSNRGLFARRTRKWSLPGRLQKEGERDLYGDRRLAGNGITYPLSIEEIESVIAERRRQRSEMRNQPREEIR